MCADTAKYANILIRKGIFDWKHTPERLKSHEQSKEHIDAVAYAENFHGGVGSRSNGGYLFLVCAVCDVTI